MKAWEELAYSQMQNKIPLKEIVGNVHDSHFKNEDYHTIYERVRGFIKRKRRADVVRNVDKYIANDIETYAERTEYKADGSLTVDKLIEIHNANDLTPERIMELHGLDKNKWKLISYCNNKWQQTPTANLYQSKVVVKPRINEIDFDAIDAYFIKMDRKNYVPQIRIKKEVNSKKQMAEVNIADAHLGKLAWHGETGENYDHKIARKVFEDTIDRACRELSGRNLDYILFVWSNDFFNSDTTTYTTTKGTPQDTDCRWQKLFNVGVEMLVNAIDMLSQIAPVKTFYTRSNHDQMTGYMALKFIEAWFRKNDNVTIDIDANARKYYSYGNTLLGYTHGDKENPKRLSGLMPIEAKELWGKTIYREYHVHHLHSEHMIEEINGVIVRRISSPTATDTWHHEAGFVGSVRKSQIFIYDFEDGLINTINIPVRKSKDV